MPPVKNSDRCDRLNCGRKRTRKFRLMPQRNAKLIRTYFLEFCNECSDEFIYDVFPRYVGGGGLRDKDGKVFIHRV